MRLLALGLAALLACALPARPVAAPVRKAHPCQGAAFLSYFVDKEVPWAHLDIAGTHASDSDSGPFIKGPTGFGTRLLAELVASQG